MDLYVLRHAIAEPREGAFPGGDSLRPLTAEGEKKMGRAAKGMKAMKLSFDLILSSPYVRAKQTADIVAELLHQQKGLEFCDALAADGNPKDLIDDLRKRHRKRKSILLVGHEPPN